MSKNELQAGLDYVQTLLRELHGESETRDLTPEEWTQVDEALTYIAETERQIERHNQLETAATREQAVERTEPPQVVTRDDPADVLEDRAATPQQLADALTRSAEGRGVDGDALGQIRAVANRHSGDDRWARNLIARSTPLYERAWSKMMSGRPESLTPDESRAIQVGTNTAGGFLVPTHLDPTIILTNDGTSNAIRRISRVETLTEGGTWFGVSSAGMTAAWTTESSEATESNPELAQPSVPVHKATLYATASVEALQDTNIGSQLARLFADARDRLEGAAHATGTGSDQPTGIFTALDANTNVEILTDTANSVNLADLQEVYRSVPVRWRGSSSWLMHPLWLGDIQALGTAVSATYSTDLTQPYTPRIIGRPVVESDDAPSTTTTTANDNITVFGDFSNYVIVDKPGSFSIELVPHVLGSNRIPSGERGYWAYWRTGADSVVDTAFRLLQDETSA